MFVESVIVLLGCMLRLPNQLTCVAGKVAIQQIAVHSLVEVVRYNIHPEADRTGL